MTELKMIENLEQFLKKLPTEEVKVEVVQRYIRHLKMERRLLEQLQKRESRADHQ